MNAPNGEEKLLDDLRSDDIEVAPPPISDDPADIHDDLANATDFCDAVIQVIGELAINNISECIDACHATIGGCDSCVRGLIQRELETIGLTLMECDQRIINDLVSHMMELASNADIIGIPPPPPNNPPPSEIITIPDDAHDERDTNGHTEPPRPPTDIEVVIPLPNGDDVPPPPPPANGNGQPPPPIPRDCPTVPTCPDPVECPPPAVVECPPCPVPPPPNGTPPPSPNECPYQPPTQVTCPPPTVVVNIPPTPQPPPPEPPSCEELALYNRWLGAAQAIRWTAPATPQQIDQELTRILGAGRGQLWEVATYPDVGVQGRIRIEGCYAAIPAILPAEGTAPPAVVPPSQPPPSIPASTPSFPGSFFCFLSTSGPGSHPADRYVGGQSGSGGDTDLFGSFALATDANPVINNATESLPDSVLLPVRTVIRGLLRTFAAVAAGIIHPIIINAGCVTGSALGAAKSLAFGKFFGNWFGAVPDNVTEPLQQLVNYQCQWRIPSTTQLNDLVSRGWITPTQWNQLVRANADCVQPQEVIVNAMQTLPNLTDTIMARRRGLIDDAKYAELLGRNAVQNADIANVFFRLTEWIPGPSDLVRFMQRDAADDNVASKYGYDQEFTDKWVGRVREFGQFQGLSDEVAKLFWRSHWQLPSPTQLYEMLHRLRPTDRNPNDPFLNLTVTYEDVIEALKINDLAPGWVAKLAAMSYKPLTRVDVRRAYEIGVLTEEDVYRSYLDLGYDPNNAKFLTEFAKVDAVSKRAKRAGFASQAEVLKWYTDMAIDRQTALTMLADIGIKDARADAMLVAAEKRRTAANQKQILTALKGRFLKGEFDQPQLNAELIRAGIDVQRAGSLLTVWTQIRDAKFKAPTVAMLCKWWGQGLINADEVVRRARNLGYSAIDAVNVMNSCGFDMNERRKKDAERIAKDANVEARRRAKELEAARKAAMPCKPPPKPTCPSPVPEPQPEPVLT